jgi:hypothetical protein
MIVLARRKSFGRFVNWRSYQSQTRGMARRLCLPLASLWKDSQREVVAIYKQKLAALAATKNSIRIWRVRNSDDGNSTASAIRLPALRFSPT